MLKKICSLLTIILSITLLLSACSPAKTIAQKFEFSEYHTTVDSANGNNSTSVDLASPFENPNALPAKTVVFEGVEYSGNYWYSVIEHNNTFISDYYKLENGWFAVKSATDSLVNINFTNFEKGNVPLAELREAAENFAVKYININDKFILKEEQTGEFYSFKYVKHIDGYPTNEFLLVSYSSGGTLIAFAQNMIGEYNLSALSSEEVTRLEEMTSGEVEEEIKNIFFEEDDKTVEKNITFIKHEGKICALYNYLVKRTETVNELTSVGSHTTLILVE